MDSEQKRGLLSEERGEEERYPLEDASSHTFLVSHSKLFKSHPLLLTVFTLSLLFNAILGTHYLSPLHLRFQKHATQLSKYANIPRDVPLEWNPYSPYGTGNKNETDRSLLWESLDVSPGVISLDNDWARKKGLPPSQPFPWDDGKSLYLLNGHHSLHCMRKIRRWVTIAHHNGTQLDTYAHLVHCMDHLMQNIMCEADDTPMYSTRSEKKDAGNHQVRMCRSWDKLNEWANAHTACFGFVNETQGVESTFNRYHFCPKDSPYADKMRNTLGYPPTWYEERPCEIDSMPPYWEKFTDNKFVFHEYEDNT